MKNLIANNKPPGKGKKVIANYSKILLIILGLLVQTSTFGADTWIDPAGDNNITIDSPSFRLQFRYYMDCPIALYQRSTYLDHQRVEY